MYPKNRLKVEKSVDEENIYSEETRERWVEEEILSHEEDGIVKGYVDGGPKKEEDSEEEDEREFFSWKEDIFLSGVK